MNEKIKSQFSISGLWRGLQPVNMPKNYLDIPFIDKLDLVKINYPSYDKTKEIIQAKSELNKLLNKGAIAPDGKRYAFTQEERDHYLNYEGIRQNIKWFDIQQQRAFEKLRSLRKKTLFNMLIDGAIGFKFEEKFKKENTATLLYTDTIMALLIGAATVNQTGEGSKIGIGAGYDLPSSADTALNNQIGALKVYDEVIQVGLTTTYITDFRTTDNNGLDTTIAAPIVSASEFDLASVTGLAVGDAIQGTTNLGEKKSVIQTLSGTTVTVSPALLETPTVGDRFLQIWGEGGIFGNNAAADIFTHARFSNDGYEKDNTRAIIVESSLTLRIV